MAAGQRVFGVHPVEALLEQRPEAALRLFLQRGRRGERLAGLAARARLAGIPVSFHPRSELDAMSGGARHQGVVLEIRGPGPGDETDLESLLDGLEASPLLLVLDGVQDPRNLGACLRTAAAAGVHAVVIPRDRAAPLNAAARKVAAGAAERVPLIRVVNLARLLRRLRARGLWLVGTSAEAQQDLYHASLEGPLVLILGAEGRGMRRLTREACDQLVHIPLAAGVESLNVSVAAGVCLYEVVRRRRSIA